MHHLELSEILIELNCHARQRVLVAQCKMHQCKLVNNHQNNVNQGHIINNKLLNNDQHKKMSNSQNHVKENQQYNDHMVIQISKVSY